MKLSISRDALLSVVSIAARGAATAAHMPVLSAVLLEAKEGAVQAFGMGSDTGLSASSQADAQVQQPGTAAVHARALVSTLKAFPAGSTLALHLDSGTVSIVAGKSRVEIPAMDASHFPARPELRADRSAPVKLDGEMLWSMLRKTCYAAAEGASSAYGALHWVLSAGQLLIEATDSRMMGRSVQDMPLDVPGKVSLLIPVSTCQTLFEVLDSTKGESSVEMSWDSQQVQFQIASAVLAAPTMDANYPDIDKALPKSFPLQAVIDASELAGAIRRLWLVLEERLSGKDMSMPIGHLTFRPLGLTLEARHANKGSVVEEVPCTFNGDELEIFLNIRCLQKTLGAVESDQVEMHMIGDIKPIRIADPSDPGFVGIVVPVRPAKP